MQGAASPACLMSSLVAFFKEEEGLYCNDGLQKEDMGEGEALTLVETALG